MRKAYASFAALAAHQAQGVRAEGGDCDGGGDGCGGVDGACGGATPSSAPTTASLASDTQPIVSTGRWGCGVFGGLPAHKFTQQVLAARLAGVSLRFSTFGSPDGCDAVLDAMHKANGTSISEVWALLLDCNQRETFQRAFCDGLAELAAFNQGQAAPMSSSGVQSSAQHTV